jgi:hypothetical protein
MSEGQASRRRFPRGRATPLALAALVCVAAVGGYAGWTVWTKTHPGYCDLVTTVRTGKPSYAPGQVVTISVTEANKGPACQGTAETCGPVPQSASAYNQAGKDVWDSGAGKTTTSGVGLCWSVPGPMWRVHSAVTRELRWDQDDCARQDRSLLPGGLPNPDCPGTQLPAGTYRIVGNGGSAPAIITLSG